MFRKKKPEALDFDRANLRPVIRSSICTGERVAGFRDIRSGKISEIMLIRSDADLDEFCSLYGLSSSDISTVY